MKKNSKYLLCFVIVNLIYCFAFSQNIKIDSLKNILGASIEDTNKVNILNRLSSALASSSLEEAEKYADMAKTISVKLNFSAGLADALYNKGFTFFYKGLYDQSIETFLQSQKIQEQNRNEKGIANVLNIIGYVYRDKGNFLKATEYYLKSLKMQEAIGNKLGCATATLNIGVLYTDRLDYPDAIKYTKQALAIFQQLDDKSQTANAMARIGNIYIDQNNDSLGLDYYQHSLALFKKIEHKRGIAVLLNNIANVYNRQGKTREALNYFFEALDTRTKIGDKNGVAIILQNIGDCYKGIKDYTNAVIYLNKSLSITKEIGFRDIESTCYSSLSKVYELTKNYDKSLEYYKLYFNTHDSIFNNKSIKQLNELNVKYETEKKETDIKLLTTDKALKETAFKKQRLKLYSSLGGIVLLLLMVLLLFNRYKIKQKANLVLEKQKTEISSQKLIIEEKNKGITDSIIYAKRIQYALLANQDFLNEHLPEHFVFFQPKDIVSGDFYSANIINNKFVIITADCTGHGVPGAFMSLLNMSFLNEAIVGKHIDSPEKY